MPATAPYCAQRSSFSGDDAAATTLPPMSVASSTDASPTPPAAPSTSTVSPGWSSAIDRKSTRLNSSHEWISYAVFYLKKKQIAAIVDVEPLVMALLGRRREDSKTFANAAHHRHARLLRFKHSCLRRQARLRYQASFS